MRPAFDKSIILNGLSSETVINCLVVPSGSRRVVCRGEPRRQQNERSAMKSQGGRRTQLSIRSGSRAAQTIELPPGVIRLGRNPTNNFCFDDETISSRHCEVTVRDGTVHIRDLGSTNGTFIDGQPIKEAVLLPGQALRLGSVEIVFEEVPVHIAIPEPESQELNPFLPDGAPCCYNHAASHAIMECAQCSKTFCELCIHQISRVGGAALKLCPVCGGHCRPIGKPKVEKKRKSRISSWIGKLTAKMTGRLTRMILS
ncbi:MAG: hypothetical protein DME18_07325 [Verrucomicrobia bacterium]|nr:MAG: hypothetical protein DME18_07325 [Verrucomicrobiota bacterium]